MLENVIEQFAAAIAERAEALLAKSARGAGKLARVASKSVPVREQKRILAERASSGGAALVMKTSKRKSANKGKKLDMSCRVEGCKNTSRGPRFGFICDEHRRKLSAKQQTEAREKWKAAHAKKAA
jgi:hypothetical protein